MDQAEKKNLDVKKYTTTLNVYRRRYIHKHNSEWITRDDYLKNFLVQSSLTGNATVGFFLTYITDVFGFDVDSHGFDTDLFGKNAILDLYNYILLELGDPSFVCQSSKSGGLHAYYRLDQKYPFLVIKMAIQKKFGKMPKGIDFLPSPEHALRLPHSPQEGGFMLDPMTLDPLNISGEAVIEHIAEAPIKTFIEIFDDKPSGFINTAKTRKKQYKNYSTLKKLEKVERDLLPIVQGRGERNEKLLKLSFAYYCAGIDVQEATDRLLNNMQGNGRDYTENRLRAILESQYRHYDKQRSALLEKGNKEQDKQLNLFRSLEVDEFVEQSPFTARRKTSFKRFLHEMYQWTDYIRNMENRERIYHDFIYPFFYHNTRKRNLIPLPKSILKRWNKRHFDFMRYLIETKILTLKQNYSTDLNVCNYYEIKEL